MAIGSFSAAAYVKFSANPFRWVGRLSKYVKDSARLSSVVVASLA